MPFQKGHRLGMGNKNWLGKKHSEKTIEKMKNDGRRGRKHSLETKEKISNFQKVYWQTPEGQKVREKIKQSLKERYAQDITPWNKGKKYKLSDETKRKVLAARRTYTGSNNPNWRGGKTPLHLTIRASLEYKLWRIAVFERDNYTCTDCGIRGNQTGGYLEADHIKSFADYPELRLAIDNGRTLCSECHSKTPNYKGRK